jgi:hypothetical protein
LGVKANNDKFQPNGAITKKNKPAANKRKKQIKTAKT